MALQISRGLVDLGARRGPDSCDCSRDFTQCNYRTDTKDSEVEREKVCVCVCISDCRKCVAVAEGGGSKEKEKKEGSTGY